MSSVPLARTEREKMLAGELYDASDPDLVAGRARARALLKAYNATLQEQEEERRTLLQTLLGTAPPGLWIEPPFNCDYGDNIRLGENVYINFHCILLDCAAITIGDQTMLAPNVQLYAAHHPISAAARIAGPELASPITIGRRCWLGGGVIVCPGVTIGDNTTIGAGSVVTHDIPANVVAVGNPCRVLRVLPNEE